MPIITERSYTNKEGVKVDLKYPKFVLKAASLGSDEKVEFKFLKPVEAKEIPFTRDGIAKKFTAYSVFVQNMETEEAGSLNIQSEMVGKALHEQGDSVIGKVFAFMLTAGKDGKKYLSVKAQDEIEAMGNLIEAYYSDYVEQIEEAKRSKYHFLTSFLMTNFPEQQAQLRLIVSEYDRLSKD